jgi:hypothetical protein
MSHRRSSTAKAVTQTPTRIGAGCFAQRCAMEHEPWLSGSKAPASSAPDNSLGQAQPITIIIRPVPATVQHITIVASDQAAQLQSP